MRTNASTTFFESNDPQLFASYVELRRRVFHARYAGLPLDFGQPDETDRVSRIVYAQQENVLAGAARLTISAPEQRRELPMEESASGLRECAVLKDLEAARKPYGEISRMAVDPACSDGLAVSFGLGRELCGVAARNGVDVIFSICPPAAARLNRLNARKCGVGFDIYMELTTVFGIKMLLCAYSGVLRPFAGIAYRDAA